MILFPSANWCLITAGWAVAQADDGGDCTGSAPAITDCTGHRAPAEWLGDGVCGAAGLRRA